MAAAGLGTTEPLEEAGEESEALEAVFFFYCYGDHRDLHSFPTRRSSDLGGRAVPCGKVPRVEVFPEPLQPPGVHRDRKSTRLNSSHLGISYAVFCLKK